MPPKQSEPGQPLRPEIARVAIMPWGNLVEDFLVPLGVSLEDFAARMSGGWLFGYVAALRSAGIDALVVCVSARVDRTTRIVNPRTGTATIVLPASAAYRRLRRFPGDPESVTAHGGLRRAAQSLVPYLATPPGPFVEALKSNGVTHLICQEYEYERFDVVVRLAQRIGVITCASFQGGTPKAGLVRTRIRAASLSRADGLIVASSPEIARVRECYHLDPERIVQIPNPLDIHEWRAQPRVAARAALGIPEQAVVVVSHGRIDYSRKGLDILLDAWRRLVVQWPDRDLRLHLIGSGQDDAILQADIDANPVRGLRWVRRYSQDREEMRRELSAANLYVMASRHEGFPVAPLEAMACCLPAVLSDAPGAREILGTERGRCGRIVPIANAGALAAALSELIADPTTLAAMGAAARGRIEAEFSIERVGAALAAFLRGRTGSTKT